MDVKSLFFKNIGIRQTIVKNTLWLAVAEVASRFLEIILVIYITRILGPFEFGRFAFVLAFVSVFAMLSDFGLGTIATRELAQDTEAEKEFSAVLSLKLILSALAFACMIASSFFISSDAVIRKLTWILAPYAIIDHFFLIIYAFLRARQHMQYEALLKVFQSVVIVVIGFFVIYTFPSLINVGYGYLVANLVAVFVVAWVVQGYFFSLAISFNRALLVKFLKLSWPIGVASIFGALIVNVDSVIMGGFGQITEVGWYNAAKSISSSAIISSTLITMGFYPALAKFFKESREKFREVWDYYMASSIILAVPITAGGFFLSSQIIGVLYGQDFGPSITAFKILVFSVGIGLLYAPYLTVFIVANQQKKYLWINVATAVTNIVLNFLLIPGYGFYGAAAATIVTYLATLFGSVWYFKEMTSFSFFDRNLAKISLLAVILSLVMIVAINQLLKYNLSIIAIIPAGAALYVALLVPCYMALFPSRQHAK